MNPSKQSYARRRPSTTLGRLGAVALGAVMLGAGAAPAEAVPGTGNDDAAGHFSSQVLASNGDNGIDPVLGKYYRIVGLASLGNGVVLASYDGRPDGRDSPSPNSIIQRRSTDGGKTWGAPMFVARGQVTAPGVLRYGFSDPSYVVDRETGTIFNFHVYSKDAGFGASTLGNDDADRNVISSEVSVSTDGGQTWSTDPANQPTLPTPSSYAPNSKYAGFAGPLITSVVKPVGSTVNGAANVGGVVGQFAASGEGIQLQYGPHKGRLIQQFAGTVIQMDGSKQIQAYSVYSDDHGKSWHMGQPVGTKMDENKVVELSNGDVMLNSRDNAGGGGRRIAISHDGGETYGPVTYDHTLTDPRNNASITHMFPDAPEGSADAQKLLFSNADNPPFARVNGTIRYSCDNGATWSTSRAFAPGLATSYSTVTALGNGQYGVLYEGANNTITFDTFDARWLGPLCGTFSAGAASVAPGGSADVTFTVTNRDDHAFSRGTVSLTLPVGWNATDANVPALPAGQSATVTVRVTAPASAKAGTVTGRAEFTAAQGHLDVKVPVTVNPAS
ncbi:exo-alpha-sialidase [Arthrobacter sp. UYCo732]|uniref:exo-alpha-sialidase n=1 Tax=Arthrobacter sp. UYCo732 TaxID=3156336 RepID=UPI003396DF91